MPNSIKLVFTARRALKRTRANKSRLIIHQPFTNNLNTLLINQIIANNKQPNEEFTEQEQTEILRLCNYHGRNLGRRIDRLWLSYLDEYQLYAKEIA